MIKMIQHESSQTNSLTHTESCTLPLPCWLPAQTTDTSRKCRAEKMLLRFTSTSTLPSYMNLKKDKIILLIQFQLIKTKEKEGQNDKTLCVSSSGLQSDSFLCFYSKFLFCQWAVELSDKLNVHTWHWNQEVSTTGSSRTTNSVCEWYCDSDTQS